MRKNVSRSILLFITIIVIFLIYLGYFIITNRQSNISKTKPSEKEVLNSNKLKYSDCRRCFTYLVYPSNQTSVDLIIYVHGGGFVGGSALDKNSLELKDFFTKRGFAFASVEYRVYPQVNLAEILGDISKGAKTIFKYLDDNGIRVKRAIYIGSSAGAIAGALLIYAPPHPRLDISIYMDGFIGFSGGYCASYLPENLLKNSKLHNISMKYMMPFGDTDFKAARRVPALLINGVKDKLLDANPGEVNHHALCMEKWLKEHGILVKILLLPTGHGTLSYLTRGDNITVATVMKFINSLKPLEDLVAYWSFDKLIRGKVIDSINGYIGYVIGKIKLVDGVSGKAIYFNGKGYINFSKDTVKKIGSLDKGTVSLCFQYKDIDQNVLPILYFGSSREEDALFIVEIGHKTKNNRRLYVTWITGGPKPILCFDTGFNIKPNKWYHIAIVIDEKENTLYLNGKEVAKRHYNFGKPDMRYFFADIPVKELFTLGYGKTGHQITKHFLLFHGAIDELRIYSRPLTKDEIKELYLKEIKNP